MSEERPTAVPPAEPPHPERERFSAICELMTEGATAREACRQLGIKWGTFCSWKRGSDALLSQYARAREDMIDFWADEIIATARNRERDVIESVDEKLDAAGNVIHRRIDRRSDNTAVNRDRLDVDTVKWLLCKLRPEKYGDVQRLEHTGANGGPIELAPVDVPPPESREAWEARVSKRISIRNDSPPALADATKPSQAIDLTAESTSLENKFS